jgi:hypothetical protein
METRPVLKTWSALAAYITRTTTRHQSTTSRTKRMLKVAPHKSMIPGEDDSVVYNPPSSAASVYHTPFKFLPKSDPRRQANLSRLFSSPSGIPATASGNLPPQVAKRNIESTYNVTRDQVDEMRRLRAEDPAKWSVLRLAEKYNCSNYFIMMCCRAPAEHRQSERDRLAAIKARWGPVRTQAREERQKRRVLLYRGEL